MRSLPHGLTLIELLALIAIIAILVGIALPQYQKHEMRTQVDRAVRAAGALRQTVDGCIAAHHYTVGGDPGECDPAPAGSDILTGAAQGSHAIDAAKLGVPQLSDPLKPAAGTTITATFGHQVNPVLDGDTVIWTRDARGAWTCTTTVPAQYAAADCPTA